jgi:hypothetical protein
LPFGLVFAVLFAFWTAMAVCFAAVVIVTAWDARDDDAASAAAPTSTSAPTQATPTPDARPAMVPATAQPLTGEYDSGELPRHLFFHLECAGDVLAVITTDEHVYAETECPPTVDPVFVRPFQGDPVRITIADAQMDIVSLDGERLTFDIGRAWIEPR